MALSLANKTVLITGATDGLGKHIASALAQQGTHLIIHGRNEEKVQQTVSHLKEVNASINVQHIVCDLNKPEKITEHFSTIQNVDVLINNAGVWLEGNTLEAQSEKIIELTHVNLLAPLLITRTVLPSLLKSDFAQILNIVSIAGVEIPAGYYHTIYSAVKFGLQGFSEALAKEFYSRNIRVMGYYPGGMETNLFKKAGNEYKEHEPWMFSPQESVEAILFMLTRDKKVNVKRMDLINQLDL